MTSLQYVGRNPDTDSAVVTKSWSDTQNTAVTVTPAWVNSTIAAEIANDNLQTPAYVDQQDALRAHKTDVDTADLNYVPISQLSVPNGVAALDASGDLLGTQIPAGVTLSRYSVSYSAQTIYLAPGATHQVNTSTLREFKLATISIPDPGYIWRPLVSGIVGGYSLGGTAPPDPTTGTGNFGLVAIIPPAGISDVIYGVAVCTALYNQLGFYPLLPHGVNGSSPLGIPAVSGPLELDMWASCYTGAGYVFTGTGLVFSVTVYPAM